MVAFIFILLLFAAQPPSAASEQPIVWKEEDRPSSPMTAGEAADEAERDAHLANASFRKQEAWAKSQSKEEQHEVVKCTSGRDQLFVAEQITLQDDPSRFNYAADSAGAKILGTSRGTKSAQAILNADNDRYLMNRCEDPLWWIVQLSEDIVVDSFALANLEHYSSGIGQFSVFASETPDQWTLVGQFSAKYNHQRQFFQLNEPVWARYLKFSVESSLGHEYLCTLTYLHVYGSTMLQNLQAVMDEGDKELREMKKSLAKRKALEPSTFQKSSFDLTRCDRFHTPALAEIVRICFVDIVFLELGEHGPELPSAQQQQASSDVGEIGLVTKQKSDVGQQPHQQPPTQTAHQPPTPQPPILKNPPPIFKTLADRIKQLELTQSLMNNSVEEALQQFEESVAQIQSLTLQKCSESVLEVQLEMQKLRDDYMFFQQVVIVILLFSFLAFCVFKCNV